MLQFIRDRAQGVFAWIIVGLIIIPFALWGLNEYVGGGGAPPVASVNGSDISQNELENAYYRQRQRLQQMFGDKIPANLFNEERMRAQLLEQLIEDRVVLQSSSDHHMRVGNGQLWQMISSFEVFQEQGQFSPTAYERTLAQQGMQPGMFEEQLRRDLLLQQYRKSISDSAFVTPKEVEQQVALQQQTRDIGYTIVSADRFNNEVSVSEEAINQEYQSHGERYQRQEQVSISYIELKQGDIADTIEVSEEELRNRYDAQIINYRTPEERRASHILIEVESGADEAGETEAREQAQQALNRLTAGEEFATVAKELSQDPGSAESGGDLGFFGRGVMDPAFEESSFSLNEGEMSGLVRSSFGFHIIKVTAIRGGETKTFAEVRETIKAELQAQQAERLLDEQAEQLASLSFENPDTLEPAAEALGFIIQQSPLFTRQGGEGVTAEEKVIEAAFSEDVLDRGNNSALLELDRQHLLVLRIKEHQPQGVKPLEEVKDEITANLKRDKGRALARDMAEKLLASIDGGEDAAAAATELALTWQEKIGITRSEAELEPSLVSQLFKMAHPRDDSPQLQLLELENGDYAVVRLTNVTPGLATDDNQTQQVKRQLQNSDGAASLAAVISKRLSESDISRRR